MTHWQRHSETIDSITIERMLDLLEEAGFHPNPLALDDEIEHPPLVGWESHDVRTVMQLRDDDAGDRQYTTVIFSAEMPPDWALWEFWYNDRDSFPRDFPKIRMERRFSLAGVRLDWVRLQIYEWDRRVFLERLALQSRRVEPDKEVVN